MTGVQKKNVMFSLRNEVLGSEIILWNLYGVWIAGQVGVWNFSENFLKCFHPLPVIINDSSLIYLSRCQRFRFQKKVHCFSLAQKEINMMYAAPLVSELENLNSDAQNECENYVQSTTKLIFAHSQCFAAPIRKRKRNKVTYVSLPTTVKSDRKQCKTEFDSWTNNDFNTTGEIHDDYRYKRKEYRFLLLDFFNQLEVQKSIDLVLPLKLTKNFSGSF